MKTNKILNYIKSNDLIIPNILLNNYKLLNINEKELIFLSFLMNKENLVSFDPVYFKEMLSFEVEDIVEIVSDLSTKKLIDIVVKKEEDKMKEFIDITNLYDKLVLKLIDEDEEEAEEENDEIYTMIEQEFGRTLSPIEYETIGGWINSNISEELIKAALKEAVLNGVTNLKYIDKILYEWSKKGYKKVSDIKKKKVKEENIELFDYDWLDDND